VSDQFHAPGHFTLRKKSAWYPLDRRLGGPTTGLDEVLGRKIPSPCRHSWPRSFPKQLCFFLSSVLFSFSLFPSPYLTFCAWCSNLHFMFQLQKSSLSLAFQSLIPNFEINSSWSAPLQALLSSTHYKHVYSLSP